MAGSDDAPHMVPPETGEKQARTLISYDVAAVRPVKAHVNVPPSQSLWWRPPPIALASA